MGGTRWIRRGRGRVSRPSTRVVLPDGTLDMLLEQPADAGGLGFAVRSGVCKPFGSWRDTSQVGSILLTAAANRRIFRPSKDLGTVKRRKERLAHHIRVQSVLKQSSRAGEAW